MNITNIAFQHLQIQLGTRSVPVITVECFFHLVVILSSLTGNTLVLLVILQKRNSKTITNKFIASLAFSDILLSVFGGMPSFVVLLTSEWKFGFYVCQLQGITIVVLSVESITTLMLMAINRYYRVVKARQYNHVFTDKSTKWMICGSWVFSFLSPWPYLLAGHSYVFHPGKFFCYKDIDDGNAIIFSTTLISVYIGVPLLVITTSYFLVFQTVKSHNSHMALSQSVAASDIKITETLFLLVLTFIVSWIPVIIIDFIDLSMGGTSMDRKLYVVYTFCGLSSSSFNPIIYSVRNSGFRAEVLRVCCFKTSRVLPFETRPTDAPAYSHNAKNGNNWN